MAACPRSRPRPVPGRAADVAEAADTQIRSASERYVPAGAQLREHALILARETADRLLEQGAAEIMSTAEKGRDPRIKPS